MKKFAIALMLLFIVNLSCKKIIQDEAPCACSPVALPALSLVIKNASGEDLLSAATVGSFKKEQIQLYYKNVNGNAQQIDFVIRPPFAYGTDKFNYNSIVSTSIISQAKSMDQIFYLKLGDSNPIELNLQIGTQSVEKLMADHISLPKETNVQLGYWNIFYMTK